MAVTAAEPSSPFVGRESEFARLMAGLEALDGGQARLFLIAGEPGIGKSRLIDELARAASERQHAVLWGRCWESGGAPAYWPWTQILRSVLATFGDAERAALLPAWSAARNILSELDSGTDGQAREVALDPEEARFRVLEAVTALLRHVSRQRPMVILLDDVHAADRSSLLLLRFLVRELHDLAAVLVVTYRDAEAARNPAVADTLADILRAGERLSLSGIEASAVARLVETVAPANASAATIDAIYTASEGNPLFVTELVRLWAANPKRTEGGALLLPVELRHALRVRLAPLPDSARRLLAVAAVMGREFDLDLLEVVAGTPAGADHSEAMDTIDGAIAASIVLRVRDGENRFAFSHLLLRDVLYEDLRTADRIALHRRFAAAMERVFALDLSSHLAEIAHHYAEAAIDGDVDKAVEFARRAGDHAVQHLAYEDAVPAFERGLRILNRRRGGPRPGDRLLRCELLLALAEAIYGTGDIEGMRAAFLQAADLARGLPPGERGAPLARAALGIGEQRRAHVAFDTDAVALLEEAAGAIEGQQSPLHARVLSRLAYWLYTKPGSQPERLRLCQQATEIARQINDPKTLRWVLNDCRWALWGPDSLDGRRSIGAELARLPAASASIDLVGPEHAWRLVDLLDLGDLTAFRSELDAWRAIVDRHPQRWLNSYVRRFETTLALLQGRFGDAERYAGEMLGFSQRVQREDASLIYGTQMLAIRIEQGRLKEVDDGMRVITAQNPSLATWDYLWPWIHTELEREDEVRAALARLGEAEPLDLPHDYQRLNCGAYLAEACAFVGDAARARRIYGLLLPYAQRCVTVGFGVVSLGSMHYYLGLLTAAFGQTESAIAHFEAALVVNRRIGAAPAAARTQFAHARLLLSTKDAAAHHDRALQLLHAAASTAEQLGMEALSARAARYTARAQRPAPVADRPQALRRESECTFRREGDVWTLGFAPALFRLSRLRGLAYLEQLLQRPGEAIHVFDLIDRVDGVAVDSAGSVLRRDKGRAERMIDTRARAAYKERLRDLRSELAGAETSNDIGRMRKLQEEIDAVGEHLLTATGFAGRERTSTTQANRARMAVAKAIRGALARIDVQCPELAQHLAIAVRTGTFCSYIPDPLNPVRWSLG